MIFVTVGTTSFPFDRLLKAVDEAVGSLRNEEELIVQKGVSTYKLRYSKVKVFNELPFDKIVAYLKKARVVITHGGPASIFLALKYGQNRPLVVPRIQKFGEHVDDHELYFARFLKEQGKIKAILPVDDLTTKIKEYLSQPIACARNESAISSELVKKLADYTNSID